MDIQQIRNATMKLHYGGHVFLLEPWLVEKGEGPCFKAVRSHMKNRHSPLDALPFPPEEILRDVDHLLVSHLHPDHFSEAHLPLTLKVIAQNQQDKAALKNMGFQHTVTFSANRLNLGALSITRVDGAHGDSKELCAQMGVVSGFVFQHPDEKTLYLCGDTILNQDVAETIQTFRPDVIVANCCAATNLVGRLIMDAEDILHLSKMAAGASIIATHLDSVNHALLTRADIRRFVAEHHLENVHIPENGDVLSF